MNKQTIYEFLHKKRDRVKAESEAHKKANELPEWRSCVETLRNIKFDLSRLDKLNCTDEQCRKTERHTSYETNRYEYLPNNIRNKIGRIMLREYWTKRYIYYVIGGPMCLEMKYAIGAVHEEDVDNGLSVLGSYLKKWGMLDRCIALRR